MASCVAAVVTSNAPTRAAVCAIWTSPSQSRSDASVAPVFACSSDIIGAGTSGFPAEVPEWPRTPGVEFSDGSVLWRSFDNRIGLKMIRITIRYVDGQTGSPRQLSIYHSFVES